MADQHKQLPTSHHQFTTYLGRFVEAAHFMLVGLLGAVSMTCILSAFLPIVFSVQRYFAWLECRIVEDGIFPDLVHIWMGIGAFAAAFYLANQKRDVPVTPNNQIRLIAALLIFGSVLWLGSYALRIDPSDWRWDTIERDDPDKINDSGCVGRPRQPAPA